MCGHAKVEGGGERAQGIPGDVCEPSSGSQRRLVQRSRAGVGRLKHVAAVPLYSTPIQWKFE
eukprot:10091273-Alexandrium_andersonii.AAC.1